MKKSFLTVLLAVAFAVPALAQNMWIGGSLGYGSLNTENNGEKKSVTSWSIEPEFGYGVNDKWDIGLGLSYFSGQIDELYGEDLGKLYEQYLPYGYGTSNAKETSIAPFVRYHVAKIGGFDVMLKGSIFYVKHDLDILQMEENVKVNSYGISVAPVISYSINETWSIGATLNFAELSFVHAESDDESIKLKGDKFGFNLNNGSVINIGLSYNF